MNKLISLSKLNLASFFNKGLLKDIVGGNDGALSANINRWLRNGKLVKLKNGLYVTQEFCRENADSQAYVEFVSNKIKMPSYLSGEYVLQKYGMLSESVFSISAVTRKKTRAYTNKLGTFTYSNIKKDLFCGFNIVSKSVFEIKEANKSKALFDFLYFRLRSVFEINQEVVDSFRLNLESMSLDDYKTFQSYIDKSGVKKFANLVSYLKRT